MTVYKREFKYRRRVDKQRNQLGNKEGSSGSMSKTIQIRVDDNLKTASDKLFEELGTSTNEAIKMFLKKAIRTKSIPFSISINDFNETTIEAFEEVEKIKNNNSDFEGYQSSEDLFNELGL